MGNNIIIDHPFLYNRHVLAQEVGRTTKTIAVRYWDTRNKTWKDEEKRRKIGAIVRLPEMDETALQKVSERLVSFSAELEDRQKKALLSYHEKVKGLANG